MARIEKFEDLLSWQRARALTRLIYRLSKDGQFAKDFGLRDQLRRASVSILSNIAEGFERSGDREFKHFLSQAKGSAAEVRAQLYVALDEGYISEIEHSQLKDLTLEISRLLSGMMTYLQKSDLHGRKITRLTPESVSTQDSELKTSE